MLNNVQNQFFACKLLLRISIFFLVLCASVLGYVWYYAYRYTNNAVDPSSIPVIFANQASHRTRPIDPGGVVFSNQDKEIYSILDHSSRENDKIIIKNSVNNDEALMVLQDADANADKPDVQDTKTESDAIKVESTPSQIKTASDKNHKAELKTSELKDKVSKKIFDLAQNKEMHNNTPSKQYKLDFGLVEKSDHELFKRKIQKLIKNISGVHIYAVKKNTGGYSVTGSCNDIATAKKVCNIVNKAHIMCKIKE